MKKILRYIRYIFRDCYKAFPMFFVMIMVLYAVSTAVSVANPLLLANILKLAAGEGSRDTKGLICAIVLYGLCLTASLVVDVFSRACFKAAEVKGEKYFGSKLVAFSKKIRLEALENPETLDKFHRANMGENGQFTFFQQIVMTVGGIFTCIGIIAVVGSYSPLLILTGVFELLPLLFTKVYFEKRVTALRRRQSAVIRRCGYLRQLFSGKESVKEMRVMGFEGYLTDKWKEANAQRVQEYRDTNLDISKKQVWGIIAQNVCYTVNIGLAFYLLARGKLSIDAFAACLAAFAAYENSMILFIVMAFQAIHTYHVVEDYYDYFTIPTENDGTGVYQPFKDRIKAENVHFRYSGSDQEALSGLSCEIKQGEHVVIVGENGSGKTTFSKLLTGAYLPASGSIAYDGQRTEDLNRLSLYDHISVVPQDFVHYRFTLRENVAISDLERIEDTEAMEELLRRICGEGFVESKGGLDTQLGREFNGQELSGGEWQKLAVARGLWKGSDIIILDEPTSALDPLVEYDILSDFIEMIRGRTSIIISHRVGICRNADKIIVLKSGRVAECGRHEELLAKGGEYARLWQSQAKWYVQL